MTRRGYCRERRWYGFSCGTLPVQTGNPTAMALVELQFQLQQSRPVYDRWHRIVGIQITQRNINWAKGWTLRSNRNTQPIDKVWWLQRIPEKVPGIIIHKRTSLFVNWSVKARIGWHYWIVLCDETRVVWVSFFHALQLQSPIARTSQPKSFKLLPKMELSKSSSQSSFGEPIDRSVFILTRTRGCYVNRTHCMSSRSDLPINIVNRPRLIWSNHIYLLLVYQCLLLVY